MLAIALRTKPNAACIVPERREEVTTEGGLDVVKYEKLLTQTAGRLKDAGIRVSLFINADPYQVEASRRIGADIVEFHTGPYCHETGAMREKELARLIKAIDTADSMGLECHAGHGLTFDTVQSIAKINAIVELNIGHFLIGEAIFLGLKESIITMRGLMDDAR
jgi:pyridoxine 5-phosphate synthase